MPNHVENELLIEGKKADLKKFKAFAKTKESVLDTDKFIPYPKKFKEQDKKVKKLKKTWEKKREKSKETPEDKKNEWFKANPYPTDSFNSGGYEWCLNNWGTKWGIYRAEVNRVDFKYEELEYTFDTAWSPCLPVVLKMSKMFKNLKFNLRYFEGGNGFHGYFVCKAGKVIEKIEADYFGHRGG